MNFTFRAAPPLPTGALHPQQFRGEIMPVQYGRGIAALLVCLSHYGNHIRHLFGDEPISWLFRAGHCGVEFFFVLSGYIILRAHYGDIGNPSSVSRFYIKRAIRIIPMYWLIAMPLGLVVLAQIGLGKRELSVSAFLMDLFLLPRPTGPFLQPAWTLEHEAIFYLVFSLVILWRRLGLWILIGWQVATLLAFIAGMDVGGPGTVTFRLFSSENLGFGVGLLIAYIDIRYVLARFRIALAVCAVAALFGLVLCFGWEFRIRRNLDPGVYIVLFGLVLPALASAREKSLSALNQTLGRLGSASYVLYLFHEHVAVLFIKLMTATGLILVVGGAATYALMVAAAVVAALAIHYFLEQPVLRFLRTWFIASSGRKLPNGADVAAPSVR